MIINNLTFVGNNTCHASRKISAPGQVFAFYKTLLYTILYIHIYELYEACCFYFRSNHDVKE